MKNPKRKVIKLGCAITNVISYAQKYSQYNMNVQMHKVDILSKVVCGCVGIYIRLFCNIR